MSAGICVAGSNTRAQMEPSVLTIAVGVESPVAEIAEVDARIPQMLGARQLVRTYAAQDPTRPDRRHEYFVQFHRGVPVAGGGLSRQLDGDTTVSAYGTLFLGIGIDTTPGLPADLALMGLGDATTTRMAPGSEMALQVLPQFDGTYRLTYRATFQDGLVRYVDAVTGALVRSEDAFVHQGVVGTGTGAHGDRKKVSASRANGTFEAVDRLRPASIQTRSTYGTNVSFAGLFQGAGTVAVANDNVWAHPAVVDAHVNMGLAYDYFHQYMDWPGLDGANARIDQVVVEGGTLSDNAFFASPASQASNVGLLAFGMASTGYPVTPLDIVGHEAMHGVTFFAVRRRAGTGLHSVAIADGVGPSEALSAGNRLACNQAILRFSDGSTAPMLCIGGQYALAANHGGAINEGFADVAGTAIELRFQPPGNAALHADYVMAEDTAPGGASGSTGLFRSLDVPGSLAVDPEGLVPYPDHMDRRLRYTLYVRNNQIFVAPFAIINGAFVYVPLDNGGVHFNATIFGHAYYLAVEGGTNRTSGRTVTGVGFANRLAIERVFFRAMTALMPAAPTFDVAASALRQAAADLHGTSSDAYRAVDDALLAVGL